MIKVENARFGYVKDAPLFDQLSFSLNAGEVLAILGANGIGKTTLLKCMMRFLKFEAGSFYLDGSDVAAMSNPDFWANVSYVPQAKNLVFGYTALNMVVMGRSQQVKFGFTPSPEDYEDAFRLLDSFHMADIAHRSCNKLSGGQLQMVLIARALIKRPKVLIMDEPESHLDMKNQLKVLDVIRTLSRDEGITILINTHFPAHALRCSHKTLMLGTGNYVFGDTAEIITEEQIAHYFDVDCALAEVKRKETCFFGLIPLDIRC